MTKNKEDEERQSVVIEAMRFPLIVLVLVVHVLPFDLKPVELDFSSMGIYIFVSEMISHNLGRIVVPCFFLFSGYFFFRKMNQWSIGYYGLQLKKRLNTLLIPYLLWNVLFMLAICSKYYLFNALSIDQNNELNIFREYSFFELLWLPLNFPLWYVRDLICMTILTPLFYILFKYTNTYGLLALLIVYLSTWDTGIQGLSITAFFYFGFGAYMGIYKKNILSFASRIALLSTVLSVIFLLLVTYYNGHGRFYEHIVRLFIPFAIIAAMNGMNSAVRNERFRNLMLKLAPTVFFVYAIHQIYIQSWIKGFFYKTSLGDTGGGMMVSYVLIPLFTLTACLAIYYVWRKVSPSSLALFTGGRNTTIQKRSI